MEHRPELEVDEQQNLHAHTKQYGAAESNGEKIVDGIQGFPDEPEDREHKPIPPNVIAAIGQVFAGVTLESAARSNACTISELNEALAHPEAQLIEPTSEWDAVDLLGAEFRETPDLLAGLVPVGVTLISAAPKVGKTRWLTQLSVLFAAHPSSASR